MRDETRRVFIYIGLVDNKLHKVTKLRWKVFLGTRLYKNNMRVILRN